MKINFEVKIIYWNLFCHGMYKDRVRIVIKEIQQNFEF